MAEVQNISGNNTVIELPFASVLGVEGYTAMVTVLLILLVPPQLFLSIITIGRTVCWEGVQKDKGSA